MGMYVEAGDDCTCSRGSSSQASFDGGMARAATKTVGGSGCVRAAALWQATRECTSYHSIRRGETRQSSPHCSLHIKATNFSFGVLLCSVWTRSICCPGSRPLHRALRHSLQLRSTSGGAALFSKLKPCAESPENMSFGCITLESDRVCHSKRYKGRKASPQQEDVVPCSASLSQLEFERACVPPSRAFSDI